MRLTFLSAAAFFSAVAPSLADECKPQRQIVSLAMTPVAGGARMSVPVTINGADKRLLLDTAAGSSSLTAAVGEALSLRPQYLEGGRLLDANGNASTHYFKLEDFQLGALKTHNIPLIVTPDPNLGTDMSVDGVLAPDLMDHYDVELDFAARKLNYFGTDHCPQRVIYWPAASAGFVPITLHQRSNDMSRSAPVVQHIDMSGQVIGPAGTPSQAAADAMNTLMSESVTPILGVDIATTVSLDGKQFSAVIDTGAEMSTLNSAAARAAFDVTADSPGSTPVSRKIINATPAGKVSETVTVLGSRDAFEHTFHTLSFGGVTVTAPHFLVRPDRTGTNDPNNDFQTGSHIARIDDVQRPDISIGMDVLKHLHLYFAFKEGRLYVTPAAPQVSAANQ